VGVRQAPDDDSLCAVPGALGKEIIMEGNGSIVSYFLGQGLQAVEVVVQWGLAHRTLGQSRQLASMKSNIARGTNI